MFLLSLVSVVGGSVRPLGATFWWPGATARPGQRGGYSGAGAWLERVLLFALESDRMVVLTLSHVARVDGW
jgi:hypothetical protein